MELNILRSATADSVFENFDFGGAVEVLDASGWEYVCPGDTWTKKVFISPDCDKDSEASTAITLTVVFNPNEASLLETYAIDSHGQILGVNSP